ncbi:MAG: hypothetical protein LUG83_04220 [Lachnospiraceae bacterium]|nr:hypothetical protein [Lachnospiraceae bacterium]
MKKITILFSILCMLLLSGCGLGGENASENIDFKGLTASQVKRVYIFSSANRGSDTRKLAELSEEDINSLVLHLNLVELSGDATEHYKQVTEMYWEMYRIELTDGQKFDFAADNHFYVIDGNGYEARTDLGSEIYKQYLEWDEEYFPENYSY